MKGIEYSIVLLIEVQGKKPEIESDSFVAENAVLIGDVKVGSRASIWFGTIIRGDIASVRIGNDCNIQDNAVIHVSHGYGTTVGDHVSIGHGVTLHGCEVGDNCLIGMNSLIMDGAKIGKNTIIGAMSLVSKGKEIPENVLAYGNPIRVIRNLTEDEIKKITGYSERNRQNAYENYLSK